MAEEGSFQSTLIERRDHGAANSDGLGDAVSCAETIRSQDDTASDVGTIHSQDDTASDVGTIRSQDDDVSDVETIRSASVSEAPTIQDDSHEESEISTIESEGVEHSRELPEQYSEVAQELQRRIEELTDNIRSEPNPFKQASMETRIDLCKKALHAWQQSDGDQFKEIVAELNGVEWAEAEEQEDEISAELIRKQEEAEKKKQEELKNLEKELKRLNEQLQDPSLSHEERAEILNRKLEVQGKIDAIRPPQIRPVNRQQQGQPHQKPRSLGQQVGGAAHPSRGSHAPAGGGAGAGVGRGGGRPAGGEANSARLAKSASQRIRHELEEIQKGLNADKESIEKAYKTYWTLFSSVCHDRNAFERLRQEALGALESFSERNRVRLNRLDELVGQSSGFRSGQSVDPKFLVSITTCKQNCDQFAKRLESIKETLQELTPAKAKSIELSQRPNILTRRLGPGISVH